MKLSKKERIDVLLEIYKQAQEYDRHCDRMGWVTGTLFIPISFAILAYTVSLLNELSLIGLIILGSTSEFFIIFWAIIFYRMGKQQDTITRPIIEQVATELGMKNAILIPSTHHQRFVVRYLARYVLPFVFGLSWASLIYITI